MKKKSILLLLPFAAMALAGCGEQPTPPPADPCESAVVQLNKTTLSLEVGASETLTASMSVEECDLGDVTWSSDHPEIASVENGKVTGVSAGTAVISANGASCTVTVTQKIDPPGPGTDYGTEDNPLTVAKALAIMTEECANDGDLTKQAITVSGEVKNIRNVYHYTDDIGPDCFELDLTDGTSDVYVYRLHATAEVGANIALGSTVKLVGYAKNFKGTLEFVDNKESKCTALSAVKTSKVAVSISDVVGPAEVALNSSIAVSEVTLTVNYDDESKLEGQHPDSIELDTTSAGEKTATVHYGELTGTFTVTVKNEESPNQFVDAYEAAAALEYGKSTTESYNFKGIVVAKRGTEYYVQHEGYGLDVYGPSTAPAIGDFVEVNSTMKNYNGTLETGTINKFTILESEQELPTAAVIESADILDGLKQNVLANISGTAKEDISGVSSSADYTLKLMVGTDEIPVFFKKAVAGAHADKLNGVKAGDAISISGAVTGEFKGTKQVLVVDGSTVNIPRPVSSVAFEEEAYSVLVGETVTVKANVLPEDADDKAVSYSLANASEGVEATIDAETGVVTAGTVAGTVDVVATAHGDSTKTASVTLTISSAAIPVTGVTLDKETMTIEMKGEAPWTGSLTATVAPADATDKTYTFSSSAEDVATVTNEGVVTAVAEGECDITVTTTDGAKTAVCHVSVIPEQPIVAEGTYTIKHVKAGIAYYMVDPNASSSPTASTNLADAAVFDFILQEGTLNQYKIKIHGENKYLYVTKSNSGLRIGNTEAVWTIANGSQATGAFDMSCSDGENTRYLTLFNTQDFRCYTNNTTNRSENTDLEAVVAKDVESIAIKQNPAKMTYYVGEAFDPTGMIVTVTYTDKTTEDITEGFTYEGSTGFQAANPDRTVKVTYKTKNAYVQHVAVIEDDRTIASIKFADGCDMTKKEYEVGDEWDPKGLKVIAVRSDDSEIELADSDVTFTYDKTTEAAAESMTLNVTAHYVVDDSTTLDSAAKAISVVVKEKAVPTTDDVEVALKGFAKNTSTSYVSTEISDAVEGVTYNVNNINPSSGQVKGNQTTTTGNFYMYNSTALSKKLVGIKLVFSGADASNYFKNNMYLVVGTESVGDTTTLPESKITANLSSDKTTFSFDLSELTFSYFKMMSNEKFTNGNCKDVKVVLQFEKAV